MVLPAVSWAQVLEIDAGGTVKVYDGPAVVSDAGVTPIERLRIRRLRPAARSGRARPVVVDHVAIATAADAAALSPALVEAIAWRESGFRPRIVSRAGAVGEMQLMPGTARDLGVDPNDADQNLKGGAAYLGGLMKLYKGDLVRTLAAYNAGPGAVQKYGGVPPFKETQAYVAAILERLSGEALRSGAGAAVAGAATNGGVK